MPQSPSSNASERRYVKLPVLGPVLRERSSISHSEMMRFRRCQWRWHLDYEMGMRSKIDSPDLAFGSALHKAAEVLLHSELERRLSPDESMYVFEGELSKRMAEMPQWQVLGHISVGDDGKETVVPPPDRAAMSTAAWRIMHDLREAPELRRAIVLTSELKLKEPIDRSDGLSRNFSGYIDFIYSGPAPRGKKTLLYICDFKTCQWGWDVKKRRDEELQSQLFLYKHFICKKLDLDPADVRCTFILLKRKPKADASSVEFFTISAGPKPVSKAVDMLQRAVTGMAMSDLTKDRDQCVNRWEVCPYKGTDLCPDD